MSAFAEVEKSSHQSIYSRRMRHLENLVSQVPPSLQSASPALAWRGNLAKLEFLNCRYWKEERKQASQQASERPSERACSGNETPFTQLKHIRISRYLHRRQSPPIILALADRTRTAGRNVSSEKRAKEILQSVPPRPPLSPSLSLWLSISHNSRNTFPSIPRLIFPLSVRERSVRPSVGTISHRARCSLTRRRNSRVVNYIICKIVKLRRAFTLARARAHAIVARCARVLLQLYR